VSPSLLLYRELIEAVGSVLGDWPRTTDMELMYALSGNVEYLEATGRVREDSRGPVVRYFLESATSMR